MLIVAVVGTTPSAQNLLPRIALISDDLPALNSPTTTTENSRERFSLRSRRRATSRSLASRSASSSQILSIKAFWAATTCSTSTSRMGPAIDKPATAAASCTEAGLDARVESLSVWVPRDGVGAGSPGTSETVAEIGAERPASVRTSSFCQNLRRAPTARGTPISVSSPGSLSSLSASPSISFSANAALHSSPNPSVVSHCATSATPHAPISSPLIASASGGVARPRRGAPMPASPRVKRRPLTLTFAAVRAAAGIWSVGCERNAVGVNAGVRKHPAGASPAASSASHARERILLCPRLRSFA
mmetsp:Transcript_24900/g.59310  ORF Transcript_24900/g.59310 Transcript_24900/m.59310 type:complete len:303 (+) Transcript_24900:1640-2548(+)